MSCGQPHAHDCSEVLARIYAYIDGEATADDRVWIQEHLDECGPCLQEHGIDVKVKALVARSCGCAPIPQEVRERVIGRISSLRTTVVTQTDAGSVEQRLDITAIQLESE